MSSPATHLQLIPQGTVFRQILNESPMILSAYTAASLFFGYGFANPVVDAVGLATTTTAYLVTRHKVGSLLGGGRCGHDGLG